MNKEKKTITPEIYAKLSAPMPSEAITPHPTKTFLSTIKAIYIVERLNQVFGVGKWTLKHKVALATSDYVLIRGRLVLLDYDCVIPPQYGGHSTTGKNTEIADGYKSAITDCISKSASYIGIGIDVFKGKSSPRVNNYPTKKAQTKISDDIPVIESEPVGQYGEPVEDKPAPKKTVKDSTLTCSKCGVVIPQNVADFSDKKYGKKLCYPCQQEVKK